MLISVELIVIMTYLSEFMQYACTLYVLGVLLLLYTAHVLLDSAVVTWDSMKQPDGKHESC